MIAVPCVRSVALRRACGSDDVKTAALHFASYLQTVRRCCRTLSRPWSSRTRSISSRPRRRRLLSDRDSFSWRRRSRVKGRKTASEMFAGRSHTSSAMTLANNKISEMSSSMTSANNKQARCHRLWGQPTTNKRDIIDYDVSQQQTSEMSSSMTSSNNKQARCHCLWHQLTTSGCHRLWRQPTTNKRDVIIYHVSH